MNYTVIKHKEIITENKLQASIFYTPCVFSNVQSVLSQFNTQLRLLHLLYDTEVMGSKTTKDVFSVLYSDKTWAFDQSEHVPRSYLYDNI